MKVFDVGIGWVNPVDRPFVQALTALLKAENFSFREITYENLDEDFFAIQERKLHFRFFIDRSSIDNAAYLLMAHIAKSRGAVVINDPDKIIRFGSKVRLHKAFMQAKLPLPETFIISTKKPLKGELKNIVQKLGVPFVLKPAYGGGLDDVTLNARGEEDIVKFMEDRGWTEPALAQTYIPVSLVAERASWFRPLFICGKVIPLWWDPKNHFYQEFASSEKEKEIVSLLETYIREIARITGFQLFSTEVAFDHTGSPLIVDYANQPIDLNSQDIAPDALPQSVIKRAASEVVDYVKHLRQKNQ